MILDKSRRVDSCATEMKPWPRTLTETERFLMENHDIVYSTWNLYLLIYIYSFYNIDTIFHWLTDHNPLNQYEEVLII